MLGVDGGNSKTDLVLADVSGEPLGWVRGRTVSHQATDLEDAAGRLKRLLAELLHEAGRRSADIRHATFCLAGADYPSDVTLLRRHLASWLALPQTEILNDAFAALRAGVRRRWGVAVICGAGVNAVGLGPDGRRVRFPAIGDISGDWGSSADIGLAALTAAVRARDGRGRNTVLARTVPAHFALTQPRGVTGALYRGEVDRERLRELCPLVFQAASDGDAVARGIADRLADELGAMAVVIIRRLGLLRTDVEVVLAGGVTTTTDRGFHLRFEELIRAQAPAAQVRRLAAPPVLGSVLLALDATSSSTVAERRLRERFGSLAMRTVTR